MNVFQNDPADQNADHSRSLPVPATFVIDRDGIVRLALVTADWPAEPAGSRPLRALPTVR